MNLESFTYQGKKYQIGEVTELEPESGCKRIQITTTDKEVFNLVYQESIFKWVITAPDARSQGIFRP